MCKEFCPQGGLPQCMLRYPPPGTRHPTGTSPPPQSSACWEIRSTSGRYASYWNAILLPPTTKLGQGYVFTHVCDSVHRGVLSQHALQQVSRGVCYSSIHCRWYPSMPCSRPPKGGSCSGGGLLPGGCSGGGLVETPPGTATAVGGTHPTGMHSC